MGDGMPERVEAGPLPFPAGLPPPVTLCPAGTPPAGLAFMGARATTSCWMVPCPCCLSGWVPVLPSGSRFGYRVAVSDGCSGRCDPADVTWWYWWRLGYAQRRRAGEVEAAPEPIAAEAPASVRFGAAEPDMAAAAAAMRRSRVAAEVWNGRRRYKRTGAAHLALVGALARAGLVQPDTLRAVLGGYERKHGRDPALTLRDDYAARTIASGLERAP